MALPRLPMVAIALFTLTMLGSCTLPALGESELEDPGRNRTTERPVEPAIARVTTVAIDKEPQFVGDNGQRLAYSKAAGDHGPEIPGIIAPYCVHQAQQPLNRCMGRWVQVTTLLHELVYEEVSIPLPEAEQQQLANIEETWTEFRNEHCDLVAQQVLGGSAYPMLWGHCRATVTNERIAALQFWGEVTMEPEAAFQRLQTLDAQLQPDPDTDWSEVDAWWLENSRRTHRDHAPRYDVAQALWLDYRDAHCEFETTQILTNPFLGLNELLGDHNPSGDMSEADALRLRCQTRLTVERLPQLEDLATEGW